MAQTEVKGIDVEPVTAWFVDTIADVEPPLTFDFITGGHSNMTFAVTDAKGNRFVLRRPPLHHVLATAHDMSREHRIISALGPTEVPVPPALGLCTDESVNGAPFYVMGYVEGNVVRDANAARTLYDEEQRRRAGESIVDVLAAIHRVDLAAVGLDDLGRHDGYIERQLKRWYGQFQKSNDLTKRPVPLIDELHERLAGAVPDQQGTAIVHGDYRLDNCMLGADGAIAAVLDWEICTLGDPLADVGLLMVYWNEASDSSHALLAAPTAVEGFPTRAELVERYGAASHLDLSHLDYYVAFGYWKLACIVEGVYSRYAGGAMGSDASGFEGFERQVTALAEQANATAERAGV